MTARPHEHSFKVRGRLDFIGGRVMKRGIVDCTDDLAGRFVAKSEEMRKVILAESGIVRAQASDTLVADGRRFVGKHSGVCDRLDAFAMFFPLIESDFLFSSSSHDNLLDAHLAKPNGTLHSANCKKYIFPHLHSFDAHLLRNIEVLVFIDSLDEFRSNIRVDSRAIFDPLRERHKHLDGIDDVSLLVEFLNYRG